ncbi:MAG: hypothetical protein Fur0020_14320 [Thermodesulfovibrionia bacterium]
MRNVRKRYLEQRKKIRRLILWTIGGLLFIYITLYLIIGDGGIIKYIRLQSTRDSLLAEINAIKKRNDDIRIDLEKIERDESKIEELARERGLSKEGEVILKFEDEKVK